jgi:hypothetical protein
MQSFIFFTYLSCILVSVIFAFIYRDDLKRHGLFIFLPYLIFVFIQELGIYFYLLQYPDARTGIFYNIYRFITVMVFSFLFYHIPFKIQIKKIILLFFSIYLIFTFITFFFIHSIFTLNNYLGTAGGLIITSYGIFFLFFYFALDNVLLEKRWRPQILITIGLVTFYPVINIANAFDKYLLALDAKIFGIEIYNFIPQVMSIFMYSSFARAFYLCRKIKQT